MCGAQARTPLPYGSRGTHFEHALFMIANHTARAKQSKEPQHPDAVRPPSDDVTDEDDPIRLSCPHPFEQLFQFGRTAVNVSDDDRPCHVTQRNPTKNTVKSSPFRKPTEDCNPEYQAANLSNF